MKTTVFTLLIFICLKSYSQNSSIKMSISYNSIALYDPIKKEYNESEKYPTTFIFDYNSNRDILKISPNGEKNIFYTVRITNNLKFDNNTTYTEIDCLNAKGKQVSFILFDDIPDCMIMSDNINAIRFTK